MTSATFWEACGAGCGAAGAAASAIVTDIDALLKLKLQGLNCSLWLDSLVQLTTKVKAHYGVIVYYFGAVFV